MTLLTRTQILAAADLPTRDVEVPEWGGTVRIRSMTGGDRDAFEAASYTARQNGGLIDNIRARYAAACIVDEHGEPMFEPDDFVALGKKSGAALDRVYSAVMEHNRVTEADIEELSGN